MGVGPFKISGSRYDDKPTALYVVKTTTLPNPNPNNYTILDKVRIGKHLVIKIQYHDCTNYEGVKILLYRNTTLLSLVKQKAIDPHFSNNKKYKSPFARFEPTEEGWETAIETAYLL